MSIVLPNLKILYPTLIQAVLGLVFILLGVITNVCKNNVNDNECKYSFKNIFYNLGIGFFTATVFLVMLPSNLSMWFIDNQISAVNITNKTYCINDNLINGSYNDFTNIIYSSTLGINTLTASGYALMIGVILGKFLNTYCLEGVIRKYGIRKVTYNPNEDFKTMLHDESTYDEYATDQLQKRNDTIKQRSHFLLLTIAIYAYLILSNALLGHQMYDFNNYSTLYIGEIIFRRIPLFYTFGCYIGKSDISKVSKALTSIFLIIIPPLVTLFTYYVEFTTNRSMLFPLIVVCSMLAYTTFVLLETFQSGICQTLTIFVGMCIYTFVYSLVQTSSIKMEGIIELFHK